MIGNKDKRIGTYYGKLISFEVFKKNDELYFANNVIWGRELPLEMLSKIKKCHVNILLDSTVHGIDTMYIETTSVTDFPKLMIQLFNIRPDEFSQVSKNWLRLWWD